MCRELECEAFRFSFELELNTEERLDPERLGAGGRKYSLCEADGCEESDERDAECVEDECRKEFELTEGCGDEGGRRCCDELDCACLGGSAGGLMRGGAPGCTKLG